MDVQEEGNILSIIKKYTIIMDSLRRELMYETTGNKGGSQT